MRDTLFNQLIAVLKGRLTPKAVKEVLREVGRSLAGNQPSGGNLERRVGKGLMALEAMGGSARIEKEMESCSSAAAVVR